MRSTIRNLLPRGITYVNNGQPNEVLKFSTLNELKNLNENQIKIKFLLSPLNPADINVIQGVYPSKPLKQKLSDNNFHNLSGNEGLGQVLDVGKSVKNFKPNDWVIMASPQVGTFRSSAILNETDLIKLPSINNLSKVLGATLAVNPPTALRMLKDFVDLNKGDIVIQTGSNSAVGKSVIQLSRALGFKTINLVRQRENQDENDKLVNDLKSLGADYVLTNEQVINDSKNVRNYIKSISQDSNKQLKLALNCVGGQETTEIVKCLNESAYLVTYGAMSKKPLTIPPGLHIFKDLKSVGFWMSRWYSTHTFDERVKLINEICQFIENGALKEPSYQIVKLGGENQTDEEATNILQDVVKNPPKDKKLLFEINE